MNRNMLLMLTPLLMMILSSCSKWQNPNTSLPSKELTIANILITPHAYDGAGVIVEGMVWDLDYDILVDEEMEVPFTTFKIADTDGNYINVFAEGNFPLIEGEQTRVTGLYRRDYVTKYRNYTNEIEAKTITLETTSTIYKIYRYLK